MHKIIRALTINPPPRRHFTDEFKRETVRLCSEPGAVITWIARDLGMGENLLRRGVRPARDGALEMNTSKPLRAEARSEVRRLQRGLRRVTMERDIPKKALGYFAKDTE